MWNLNHECAIHKKAHIKYCMSYFFYFGGTVFNVFALYVTTDSLQQALKHLAVVCLPLLNVTVQLRVAGC